jgi:hypothetical protein
MQAVGAAVAVELALLIILYLYDTDKSSQLTMHGIKASVLGAIKAK